MIGPFASLSHRSLRWSVLCWFLGLGGLLGLAGCTARLPEHSLDPAASPPPPTAQWQLPPQYETWARATYQLAVGDRVRLTSLSVPELSHEVIIGASGTFAYPYVGTVQASGRTMGQLETELGDLLAAEGLGRPDLHADVIDYGRPQIAVLGEVRVPGVYPWQPDATPLALIAQAGGLTADAWYVALLIPATPPQPLAKPNASDDATSRPTVRLDLHKLLLGEVPPHLRLASGDTLYVPPAGVYQVLGRVKSPGRYRLQRNITVLQALAQAGGLRAFAAPNRLTVWRYHVHTDTCGGELCLRQVARFDLDKPQAIRVGLHDVLQPGDVLMVPTGLGF